MYSSLPQVQNDKYIELIESSHVIQPMITLHVDRDGSISVPPSTSSSSSSMLHRNQTYLKTITSYDDSMFAIKEEPESSAAAVAVETDKNNDVITSSATVTENDVTTSCQISTVPSTPDASDVIKTELTADVTSADSKPVSDRKFSKFQSSVASS